MTEKQYQLEITQHGDYLHGYVKGDNDSVEISIAYWTELIGECRARGLKKLLIEEDLAENCTAAVHYEFASQVRALIGDDMTVAFYDRRPEHEDLNRFGALVASNRGTYGRLFTSLGEAHEWLRSR